MIWREFGPGWIGIEPFLQGVDPVLHSLWVFEYPLRRLYDGLWRPFDGVTVEFKDLQVAKLREVGWHADKLVARKIENLRVMRGRVRDNGMFHEQHT